MLTVSEARSLAARARNPRAGKPIQNNTRLISYEDGTFAVRLHATDVVTIHPDGKYEINRGGWDTVTTWDRIRNYSPIGRTIHYDRKDRCKRVLFAPNAEDPPPLHIERAIPHPFVAHDPGPEPIKSDESCIAGQIEEYSYQEKVYSWQATERDKLTGRAYRPSHRASDSELDYIVWRNGTIQWLDNAPNYWDRQESTNELKQCPHCAAFDAQHRLWTERHEGPRWGRNAGKGWALYCELVERFGSVEAWRDAAREDFKHVRENRKQRREWLERNSVPFYDGIVVDANGYADRKIHEKLMCYRERARKRQEREQRKRQREIERRQREQERKRKAALKAWAESGAVLPEMAHEVIEWLTDHGIKPNEDGKTVRLVKRVHNEDGRLIARGGKEPFEYRVGAIATADDYEPTPNCGGGLHFSANVEDARHEAYYGDTFIECDVEIVSLVRIHNKVKARSCFVRRVVPACD